MKPIYTSLIDLAASKLFWIDGNWLMAKFGGDNEDGFSNAIANIFISDNSVKIYNMTKNGREYIKKNIIVFEA